jgi:hypothetical protein
LQPVQAKLAERDRDYFRYGRGGKTAAVLLSAHPVAHARGLERAARDAVDAVP